MFKTISAALLAASIIAAPAFAAETGKTMPAAPVTKATDASSKAMNANAAVTPDAHKTVKTHRSAKTSSDVTKPVLSDKRS